MFKSKSRKAKEAAERLFNHLEQLSKNATDIEQEFMAMYIADAREFLYYNELGVGMENLLSNIYEIEFRIDPTTIELARAAFLACGMDYSEYAFIEKLVR